MLVVESRHLKATKQGISSPARIVGEYWLGDIGEQTVVLARSRVCGIAGALRSPC
jgi:hypothetical protein